MSRLTNIKLPLDYDSVSVTRQFDRVAKALNDIEVKQNDQIKSFGKEMQAVRKISESYLANAQPNHWMIWYESTVSNVVYARGKLAFSSGWANLSTIDYRYASGSNLEDSDPWIDIDDAASNLAFTLDTDNSGDYPQGGYYFFEVPLEGFSARQKKTVLHVQIRVRNSGGKIVVFEEMMFDADKLPDIYDLQLSTGSWSGTQWEVIATGFADTDALCAGFAFDEAADIGIDGALNDGDFTIFQNLTVGNTRFDKSLGFVDPDTLVFVVAKAWSAINKGGDSENPPYFRTSITTPPAPFAITDIGQGDITANMLASAAQRAQIDVSIAHKGYTTALEDVLSYSGTITWGDSTPYTLTSGELDAPTSALYYIFHDPDNDVGDLVISDTETELQITTDRAIASALTGRRIAIGVYRKGTADGEAAFFVSNTGEIAVNAPYVYAASLSAISANLGTITAGTVAVTASVEWGAVAGTSGAPESGASAGATWSPGATGISGMPVRFLEDDTPSVAGLYLAPSYMGFHDGDGTLSGWKTYTDISGNMYLSGAGSHSLTWSAAAGTLAIAGSLTLTAGSDVDFDLVSGANKPENSATAGADWDGNVANIPGRFGFDGDPDAAAASGLYASDTYFGFWDNPTQTWRTYMDASGNLSLLGDADNSFTWNGTNIVIATTGTFSVKNTTTGKNAQIINGIFNGQWGTSQSYLDGAGLSILSGSTGASMLSANTLAFIYGEIEFGVGPNQTVISKTGIMTDISAYSINPAGSLTLAGLVFPGTTGESNGHVLTSDGAGSASWVAPASGITIDIQETQIQTIGGGSPDQWRTRTVTYTNGLLTSAASFGAWADIIVP